MDSIIPLRQKNTLVEYMILSGADNRPPMLDKDFFVVPVFSPGDDLISSLNKQWHFLTVVASFKLVGLFTNMFHLKKAQQIKPTLYDGIVMFDKHVAMLVIDEAETLILEEESRSKMSEKTKDPENDSLIDKLNLKSAENEDLKAQIQDKVFVITSLKNDLRKIKGKEIVDIAAQIPSPNTIVPGIKCGSKPTSNKRNDRILQTPSRNIKNKVEAQPRKVNKKNRVIEPICHDNVKHSKLNANSDLNCATCKKSLFDDVHDKLSRLSWYLASDVQTHEQGKPLSAHELCFEESPKTPTFHDDPLNESPNEDSTPQESSSNVRQIHTLFEHLGRWTKDHPIANVTGDPSHTVSTRKQLKTDTMWCYFDAFLTSVEPKNFRQAMTELSWIDAMQEEIHEFERLEVWELVPCPDNVFLIKLKWIYKVKTDKSGGVLTNKARLVAQEFRQE
ncbi:hypothetical protein Tco_1111769 [Tanacetum coccineum]|uniref:Reverse transcriptase Ty1/copia-type domain-containing protein n=1 Tax=Tanacetum coccineum TaxID=301880 RepID=A0ABQ5INU1_9ASTR